MPNDSRPCIRTIAYTILKAYTHARLLKETCACLVLLPLQLMSTHSQLIRTVCIDYCIPLVAPRISFTVKARPNEAPCKKPELDVPIRPAERIDSDVFLPCQALFDETRKGKRSYSRLEIREILRSSEYRTKRTRRARVSHGKDRKSVV